MLEPARAACESGREGMSALHELLGEAGALMVALDGNGDQLGGELALELNRIAEVISETRTEVRNLGTSDLSQDRIPTAGRELDEVVKATEQATNRIMAAAETILGADGSDPEAYQALVTDNVMEIFEACSFQDITGQRVSKVVQTLEAIETRIDRISHVLGFAQEASADAGEDQDYRSDREKELLLNGPAFTGEAIEQNDVDEIISQDDIDALFD